MRSLDNNTRAFLGLVRAGLWEIDVRPLPYQDIVWQEVYRLASEQSVLGLVLAGLEHSDIKPPQVLLLQWIGEVQVIEQRNKAMNTFIADLIEKLRKADIYALLLKGQGVAQCYEKPYWRCSGDVDLLLSNDNYQKAKCALIPIASEVAYEDEISKHQAFVINRFDVELHGRMPFTLSMRVKVGIDDVLDDLFCRGNVRSWECNGTRVFLPSSDNDVILVFIHYLHHFFIEGVGLRQICDWCRLLWTYRDEIDRGLLKACLGRMGLMSEWKAFASLAVNHLGMPEEAMPFYDKRYRRRGAKVLSHVLKSGNLGHNNNQRYRSKLSKPMADTITFFRRIWDFTKFAFIFPVDSPKFFITYVFGKFKKNAV